MLSAFQDVGLRYRDVRRGAHLFCVLDQADAALQAAGVPAAAIQRFLTEVGQGDYERLLITFRQLVGAR
jgi:hypothetical protein